MAILLHSLRRFFSLSSLVTRGVVLGAISCMKSANFWKKFVMIEGFQRRTLLNKIDSIKNSREPLFLCDLEKVWLISVVLWNTLLQTVSIVFKNLYQQSFVNSEEVLNHKGIFFLVSSTLYRPWKTGFSINFSVIKSEVFRSWLIEGDLRVDKKFIQVKILNF